jgi:hypothetical protein
VIVPCQARAGEPFNQPHCVFRVGEILHRLFQNYRMMPYSKILMDVSEGNGAVGAALMAKTSSLGK